jgi:hypothetical protein
MISLNFASKCTILVLFAPLYVLLVKVLSGQHLVNFYFLFGVVDDPHDLEHFFEDSYSLFVIFLVAELLAN